MKSRMIEVGYSTEETSVADGGLTLVSITYL